MPARVSSCVPWMTDPDGRLRLKKDELRERLAAVCADWPPELFEEMLDELARITLRFDVEPLAPLYDRRSTDRLIDDLRATLDRSNARRNAPADGGDRSQP